MDAKMPNIVRNSFQIVTTQTQKLPKSISSQLMIELTKKCRIQNKKKTISYIGMCIFMNEYAHKITQIPKPQHIKSGAANVPANGMNYHK